MENKDTLGIIMKVIFWSAANMKRKYILLRQSFWNSSCT